MCAEGGCGAPGFSRSLTFLAAHHGRASGVRTHRAHAGSRRGGALQLVQDHATPTRTSTPAFRPRSCTRGRARGTAHAGLWRREQHEALCPADGDHAGRAYHAGRALADGPGHAASRAGPRVGARACEPANRVGLSVNLLYKFLLACAPALPLRVASATLPKDTRWWGHRESYLLQRHDAHTDAAIRRVLCSRAGRPPRWPACSCRAACWACSLRATLPPSAGQNLAFGSIAAALSTWRVRLVTPCCLGFIFIFLFFTL